MDPDNSSRPRQRTALIASKLSRDNIDIAAFERDQARRWRLIEWDGQWLYFFLEGDSSEIHAYSRCCVCHSHQNPSETAWSPAAISERLMTLRIPLAKHRYVTFISTSAPRLPSHDETRITAMQCCDPRLCRYLVGTSSSYLEISMQELALILRSGGMSWASTA